MNIERSVMINKCIQQRASRDSIILACITLICTVLVVPIASAQVPTKADPMVPPAVSKQWEYLVVSFGKTLFSDPVANPLIKTGGQSKLLAFSRAGIVMAQEAIVTQRQMDALGRFGWEMVGTVGEIGGDQEMLFKRPFDAAQSKHEAALIAREGECIAADQQAEAAKLRNVPTTELVDTDAVARQAALDVYRTAEEKRLKDAVSAVTGFTVTEVKATSTAHSITDSAVIGNVTVDGTSVLLHGDNKYSGDAAEKIAEDASYAIYQSAGLVLTGEYSSKEVDAYVGSVKVTVHVIIKFHGQDTEVATKTVGGKWPN